MSPSSYPFANSALRWLYVDFNSYFASVEQQLDPNLRGKPIAVVPVESDSTCAIAASYEAKAFGVKTGTMIYEAKQMCPGLICVPAVHERYVDFHHRICAEIENHLPISVVASIDEMACKLMDNENEPAVATAIAERIKRGLRNNIGEFVRCSIGIAPSRYLAKVATEMQKPNGLVIVPTESLPGKLLALKPRDLPGIGRNMEKRLLQNGIATMEQIWNLNANQMRKLWHSVWGERLWYMLRGFDFEEEEQARKSIGHSHVLAPELRAPAQARYVARRLTLKAASRLRRMGFSARMLSLSVRIDQRGHSWGDRWNDDRRCYEAQDNITFLHMLDDLWSRMEKATGGNRIKKVSVTLQGLTMPDSSQTQLFDPLPPAQLASRKRAEKLSFAMDRINKKYGRDAVSLGILPTQGRSFSGTKIAFTRIPDKEEFLE